MTLPQLLRRCALNIAAVLCAAFVLAMPASAQSVLSLVEGEGRDVNLPDSASTVLVADPGVADVQSTSPTSIFVTGMGAGRTNIVVRDAADTTVASYTVIVRNDTSGAQALLEDGLTIRQGGEVSVINGSVNDVTGARGVSAAQNSLALDGQTVVDNSFYNGPNLVSLRVRFIEASRTDLRRLGVDLAALGRSTAGPIRVVTGLGDPSGFLGGADVSSPAVGGRITSGSFTIDTLIDALESRGAVQILSEPTLTTMSGQTASFRAGGEFAYPVNQGDGVISAAFKEYGVSIDFTPTILPGNRIAIHVAPEVSFLDRSNSTSVEGFNVPGLSVRRADTMVEVGSGQSFAIAGLYEQQSEDSGRGVPGMSKVLGQNTRLRRERELMIFITPYLAEASDATQPRPARPAPQSTVGFITR